MIVSNPPYINKSDPHLKDKGLFYEPREALISEQEGYADIIEIIKHMDTLAPNITMWIATNGGIRSVEFWKELGELSASMDNRLVVIWGIDGLEDTNHL